MRVCYVIQSFDPVVGGAQLQLERLLPALVANGVQPLVLTKRHEERPDREWRDGAEIRRVGLRGASPAASLAFVAACVAHLLLHPRRYALVHAYGALSEGMVALVASLLRIPTLLRVLRSGELGDFDRLAQKPAGKLRIRLLLRRASFVVLSAEGAQELAQLGAPDEQVFRIPNGVDSSRFNVPDAAERAGLRGALDLPLDATIVVFAGRLRPEKDLDLLVSAVARVPETLLVLVGEGPEAPALAESARSLGIADRVRLEGRRDDVERYLRAADVFALPSRAEGMSNSLLEAMACGLACIATPVSGVPELLGDDRGLVVPAGDLDALRAALAQLAHDPAERAELGQRAAAHVREAFDVSVSLERTLAAYRALTAG